MSYYQICQSYKFNEKRLIRVDPIFEVCSVDILKDCYKQMIPGTFFICEGGGLPEGCTYWITVVRTPEKLYAYQSGIIVEISDDPVIRAITSPTEENWKEVALGIGIENITTSHYDYLEIVINEFWKSLFGKTTGEMWCAGIISAHGDKAYGYGEKWKAAGISFARGSLLFLLTYTKEFGDTPKPASCEWVIDNYQKYLPHIEAAEKLAGLTQQ